MVRRTHAILFALILCGLGTPCLAEHPIQNLIDLTPAGGRLEPEPGTYRGPAVIDKPMTLDGMNQVVIDGHRQGVVLTIDSPGVVVRNLRLTGSGHSHDTVDAGILVRADSVLVEHNLLDNVLFGIHLQQCRHVVVRRNQVSSIGEDRTLRGEGLRLWYSEDNLIENNRFFRVRDLVLINSTRNVLKDNRIIESRMGVEFIRSPDNEVSGNILEGNDHGIVGIYSDSLKIHHNFIRHQDNLLGSAIAVKGSSKTMIADNRILDCAIGLTANSPMFPENILYIHRNHFAYNDVAMYFYGDRGGHVIHGNSFQGNFQQVAVTGPTSALENDWLGNFWQDYRGFDQDGDGIGDKPYTVFQYSERIWMDRAMARFFRGSPVLEMVDFVQRLAPLSPPVVILEDPRPLFRNPQE